MEGKKFDNGKPPIGLVPGIAIEEIAKVLAFGAEKYDEYNWAKGMKWSRLYHAALRHIYAWINKDDLDKETGLSHLAHAACCIVFLLVYEKLHLGKDDRYHLKKKYETFDPDKATLTIGDTKTTVSSLIGDFDIQYTKDSNCDFDIDLGTQDSNVIDCSLYKPKKKDEE